MRHFIKVFIVTGLVIWPIFFAIRSGIFGADREAAVAQTFIILFFVLFPIAGLIYLIMRCVRWIKNN
jgi:hypothetical protein